MIGNLGPSEFILMVFVAALTYAIPILIIVWIMKKLARGQRTQDEILMRLIALEQRLAP